MSRHAGPAGSTFNNIEHAGKHTLQVNCDNYPQTDNSYILPPLFISKYPEGNDAATSQPIPRVNPPLSGAEQRMFQGICSGQGGEQTEKKVFYLLTKLLEKQQNHPMLVLRGFELNTKSKTNVKRTTLMTEYPQIQNIDMRGEADYIVLLKDLGFVCIEVKRTLDATSLQKAMDQLDRIELFFNDIMPAVSKNSNCLPIVKLIMFETDPQNLTSSNLFSTYNTFDCSGNSTGTLNDKVEDLKQELRSRLPSNPLTSPKFKRLARLLTGLWSMKFLNRQPYFDVNDASLPSLTVQVDDRVNHAKLSSGQQIVRGHPVTDVIYNQDQTVFRKTDEISLMYLTPQQKNLYDNVLHGIIKGPAGTGKTLLMLFKIIELVQSANDNRKVLLIAPHPHTIRCKNILQANNITVIVESKDYSPANSHDVVIMDIKEVFAEGYNVAISAFSSYHIFMDDFQNTPIPMNQLLDCKVILLMLEETYQLASKNLSYFWCMVDELQIIFNVNHRLLYLRMFSTSVNYDDVTSLKIPLYTLEGILRNTEEISKVVLTARDLSNSRATFFTTVKAHSSHNITSSLPTFHHLKNTNIDTDQDNFMIERLEDELRRYLYSKSALPLSDIAILYAHLIHIHSAYLKKIKEMLSSTFNIIPMSIEDQLNSRSSTIVLDDVNNAMSGEWALVILLDHAIEKIQYVGVSRARTRLIIIRKDYSSDVRPISYYPSDIEYVEWRKKNNQFVRV